MIIGIWKVKNSGNIEFKGTVWLLIIICYRDVLSPQLLETKFGKDDYHNTLKTIIDHEQESDILYIILIQYLRHLAKN